MIGPARRGLGLRAPGLLGPELACAALADGLFWGHGLGLSVAAFGAALALVAGAVRPRRVGAARTALSAVVLVAALLPAVERPTPLSALFALLGTALSLRLCADRRPAWAVGRLGEAALLPLRGPSRLAADLRRRGAAAARRRRAPLASRSVAWIVPCILTAAVAALLADANPVIAGALRDLPLSPADLLFLVPRALFWSAVLVAAWPAIRARRSRPAGPAQPDRPSSAGSRGWGDALAASLLSTEAVLRAAALLVLLLAAQLGLDAAYLWAGLALPPGLTYAGYAHRGAYPLMASALLAAGFVLAARRPRAGPPSRAAAALLALLVAENMALVASAAERLSLYVAAYGLTEWRVAALAWMGLVAFGLALIGLQGALGRDNRWLVSRATAGALALVYAWSLADVPGRVAGYDVDRCREMGGAGPALDVAAVMDLGPPALPAVDRVLLGTGSPERWTALTVWRARSAAAVRRDMSDWRSWSLSGWRLARYLDRSGIGEPAEAAPDRDGDDEGR